MLIFSHPDYLWALAALPLLGVAFSVLVRRRSMLLEKFVHRELLHHLAPDASTGKQWSKVS